MDINAPHLYLYLSLYLPPAVQVKRHVSAQLTGSEKGSIITMEQPISVSNVSLIDPIKK